MTSLTMPISKLRAVLEPAMAMAGTDDMTPILRCVQVTVEPKRVTAVATDRFRVGICTEPLDPEEEQVAGQFVLDVKDARRILTMFRGDRYSDPVLNLLAFTDAGDRVLQVKNTETLGGLPTLMFQVPIVTGQFPTGVAAIVKEACSTREVAPAAIGVNAAFLASFKAVVRPGQQLRLHPGPDRKALGVSCGYHFAGAIMPRRLTSDDTDELAVVLAQLDVLENPPKKPRKRAAAKKTSVPA